MKNCLKFLEAFIKLIIICEYCLRLSLTFCDFYEFLPHFHHRESVKFAIFQ